MMPVTQEVLEDPRVGYDKLGESLITTLCSKRSAFYAQIYHPIALNSNEFFNKAKSRYCIQ